MSPFSHLFQQLRLRRGVRQSELAEILGYEQSYISALEIGLKGPPTSEFVEKLVIALSLSHEEQRELEEAVSASQRKIVLNPDCPQDVYWLIKRLRDQINSLHPVQIQLIQQALEIRGSLAVAEPDPIRRIKRRRKEVAAM
jgi:transcriptional regulator with XRE-family HTH domain